MKILAEDEVLEFCLSAENDRAPILDSCTEGFTRPAAVLSIFELCRAIHFGAKGYGLLPSRFRACWSEFVLELCARTDNYGAFFHLVQSATAGDQVLQMLCGLDTDLSPPPFDLSVTARERRSQHPALTQRLRELDLTFCRLRPERGMILPPIELPEPFFPDEAQGGELVIDTNNLLDLLSVLAVDGIRSDLGRLSERLPETARRRYREMVKSLGGSGHIIVPAVVLEETSRKAREIQKYATVSTVLGDVADDPEHSLWWILTIEPLSQEVLNAFLHLHEELVRNQVEKGAWPDFGDALVLAHGILHGCPVASNEWQEKHDWDAVKSLFPHLVI